jgi:Flp pilus assembly secretin CpaC
MVQARQCWLLATPLLPFITFVQVLAAEPEPIKVSIDRAMVVRLPAGVRTVVLHDPLIADITPLRVTGDNLLIVITGKGYGDTNLIALDKDGTVLTERIIQVTFPTDKDVSPSLSLNK